MRKTMALILVILMVLPVTVLAQQPTENSPTPSNSKFDPIDVNVFSFPYYDETTGWSEAISTIYSYHGITLTKQKDFEDVIKPLNDPTANGLLGSAADKDAWGTGFLWGGVAVEAAGWTDFTIEMVNMGTSTNSSGQMVDHEPNMLPSVIMILGGVGAILDCVFTQMNADTDRASAADRYNKVVQSGSDLSMMLMPDTKTVGLGFTQAF